MKKIKFILLFICSVMLTTSCDYLDIAPTEVSSEEEIFSDIKTAELALGRIYWSLVLVPMRCMIIGKLRLPDCCITAGHGALRITRWVNGSLCTISFVVPLFSLTI